MFDVINILKNIDSQRISPQYWNIFKVYFHVCTVLKQKARLHSGPLLIAVVSS